MIEQTDLATIEFQVTDHVAKPLHLLRAIDASPTIAERTLLERRRRELRGGTAMSCG